VTEATKPLTGQRTTRQREAIAATLAGTEDFRSAQQIHDELLANGKSIGLTTVYRNLQALAQTGLVDVLWDGSGEMRYRHCSTSHHHHLVCRSCGKTVEIQADEVETWASKVAKSHKFADISHTVEIFGVCAACQNR